MKDLPLILKSDSSPPWSRSCLKWLTMIAREKVAAFLLAKEPRSFCDECVARALGIDPSTAYRAAVKAGRSMMCIREYGVCSNCRESRLVTRASR